MPTDFIFGLFLFPFRLQAIPLAKFFVFGDFLEYQHLPKEVRMQDLTMFVTADIKQEA